MFLKLTNLRGINLLNEREEVYIFLNIYIMGNPRFQYTRLRIGAPCLQIIYIFSFFFFQYVATLFPYTTCYIYVVVTYNNVHYLSLNIAINDNVNFKEISYRA